MLLELTTLIEKPLSSSQMISNNNATSGEKSHNKDNGQSQEKSLEAIKSHINELQNRVRVSQSYALSNMEILKNANTNIASKYYWVVFILMYVVVYLAQ